MQERAKEGESTYPRRRPQRLGAVVEDVVDVGLAACAGAAGQPVDDREQDVRRPVQYEVVEMQDAHGDGGDADLTQPVDRVGDVCVRVRQV